MVDQIGNMNRKTSLYTLTSSDDGQGGKTIATRTLYAYAWAEELTAAAHERFTGQALQSPINRSLKIYYRAGVTPALQILFDGVYHHIRGVLPRTIEGNRYLILTIEEVRGGQSV